MVSRRWAWRAGRILHEGEVGVGVGGLGDLGAHVALGAQHPELHVGQPPSELKNDADPLLAKQSANKEAGGRRLRPPQPRPSLTLAARSKHLKVDPVLMGGDPSRIQAKREELLP